MKYFLLILWIVLAFTLCLIPSGSFAWFKSATAGSAAYHVFLSGDLMEWEAHAVLMAAIAFHLVPLFGRLGLGSLSSVLCALIAVLCIAFSIEGLQGLLPESFHRGFSMSDVWSSMIGGFLGGIVAGFKGRRKRKV